MEELLVFEIYLNVGLLGKILIFILDSNQCSGNSTCLLQ